MADIFISYARPTAKLTRMIASALTANGCSVWFDEALPGHRPYADVIQEKLEEAKAVVVIWSREAAQSQWVRSEANRARERGTLVQLRSDDSVLPMPFDQIQCLDFRGWRGDLQSQSWKQLVATINELAAHGDRSAPDPARHSQVDRPWASSRRQILAAGAGATALAAAGAGFLLWRGRGEPEAPPEVQLLLQKAQTIMADGRPEELPQATAYMLEATRIAPEYPRAWGMLAFSHALQKWQGPMPARAGEEARSRSAARNALELDGDDAFASCALLMLIPPYRNWRRVEERGRELAKRHADIPLSHHLHSDVLTDVGRWRDAVRAQARIDRQQFLIPLSDRGIIHALWSAGNIQRAETMLAEAAERWPLHTAIWNFRNEFLTHSGRATEAVNLISNRSTLPPNYPEALLKPALLTAQAIAGSIGKTAAIDANLAMLDNGRDIYLAYLNHKISIGLLVAQRCAALGEMDSSFALLEGYYFARGPWAGVAPELGDEERTTVSLFEPPASNLWRDARFAALTREIGLERYWRESSSRPDYLSAA